jgi:hypothetical protein
MDLSENLNRISANLQANQVELVLGGRKNTISDGVPILIGKNGTQSGIYI